MTVRLHRPDVTSGDSAASESVPSKLLEPKLTHRNFLKVLAVAGLAGASQLASPPGAAEATYTAGSPNDSVSNGLLVNTNIVIGGSYTATAALQVNSNAVPGFTTGFQHMPSLVYPSGGTNAYGILSKPTVTITGTVTNLVGMLIDWGTITGTATTAISLSVNPPTTGTATTAISLNVNPPTVGTSKYSIYVVGSSSLSYFAGSVAIGGLTPGSVPFVGAGGLVTQDNAKFFWDDTNHYLGIGTGIPKTALDLGASGLLHVGGLTSPVVGDQGAYIGWNALNGSTGETDFINNQGGGPGGFAFMNAPNGGTPLTTILRITGTGSVGLMSTAPSARLSIAPFGGGELPSPAASVILRTNAGLLPNTAGNELALASFGYVFPANSASLGVRAMRTATGGAGDWTTTAVGFGMDVDGTVRAGSAALWLHANGNVGIGTWLPLAALHLNSGSFQIGSTKIADTSGSYYA